MISGNIAAFLTYPFDFAKTLRITNYEKYKNLNTLRMLESIYIERGRSAITSGIFLFDKINRYGFKTTTIDLGHILVFFFFGAAVFVCRRKY